MPDLLVNPRTCARGKVIGSVVVIVVVVVSTKITKSRKKGFGQSAQCHQTVESDEKLPFRLLQIAYDDYKSCIFTGHAYQPHLLMSCALHMLNIKTGMGRRVIKSLLGVLHYTLYTEHEGYVL